MNARSTLRNASARRRSRSPQHLQRRGSALSVQDCQSDPRTKSAPSAATDEGAKVVSVQDRHEESSGRQADRNVPPTTIHEAHEVRARVRRIARKYLMDGTPQQRQLARGWIEAIKRREGRK